MASKRLRPTELLSRAELVILAGLSLAKATGLILLAFALGQWIASLTTTAPVDTARLLALGLGGAILRALSGWALNVAGRRMGLGAKERMRAQLVRDTSGHTTFGAGGSDFSVPVTATLASHGLDKLDDYFTKYIPALLGSLVIPPVLVGYIFTVDLTSAIILVLTIPLVPLFMALIGMHTRDKVAQSQRGLDALAHQLYELALGLPALLGLGRARAQGNAIAALGQRYRKTTMENLKTVFLSSFWLELISTLSVAVVAVFIGLRLVGGNLELAIGLTVLIIAPEIFTALREVGSAYHAADDGLLAYAKYTALRTKPRNKPLAAPEPDAGTILQIRELNLAYRTGELVYEGYQLTLAPGERHLLDGASGTGKSTLLKAIAESQTATGMDPTLVSGQIGIRGSLAVIEQHPVFSQRTGSLQVALDAPLADARLVQRLARTLRLESILEREIAEYSPGELRRLEVLRAVARVQSDPAVNLLLADEPTAHLDAHNARGVRELLRQLPERCAQLIASHDVLLGAKHRDLELAEPADDTAAASRQNAAAGRESQRVPAAGEPTRFAPVRELLFGQRGATKALLLGVLSVICAVGLGAVSGWLIVKASYMPPVLHLMVAIVMVRALGIGRAALRYVEQLAIHDAVLGYAATLREKIWNAMVQRPGQWGIISRSSVVLRFLLAEVDELRDLLARVVFPPLQGLIVWLLGIWVMFLIQPSFGALGLAAFAGILLLVFPLVRLIEGKNLALQLEHRLRVNEKVLQILRSRAALRANGSLPVLLQRLARSEAHNIARAKTHALGQGVGVMLLSLTGMLLALSCVAVSRVEPELTAVVVLLALALIEPGNDALTAWQQGRGLQQLRTALAARGVGTGIEPPVGVPSGSHRVHGFVLEDLSLGYAAQQPLFTGLNAQILPGEWTSISGESGSGKSTLLTALLGALPPLHGQIHLIDEEGRRYRLAEKTLTSVAWCPQEAHLFDSTLARNLALGIPGQLPAEHRMIQVLQRVGLGDWFAQQPQGLQTRIGSAGHALSGGQRCRLAVARALLADNQVILLDEPTAHLGQREGAELMRQLRVALDGRTVVLITHDASLAAGCANRIVLGSQRVLQTS